MSDPVWDARARVIRAAQGNQGQANAQVPGALPPRKLTPETEQAIAHTQARREQEARDLKDRDGVRETMRGLWGDQYGAERRSINYYLNSLPKEARDSIVNETLPDGRLALNSPERLQELAGKALGPMPQTPGALASEIASIEDRMRTDRRAYLKDERVQRRYLALLRIRDG